MVCGSRGALGFTIKNGYIAGFVFGIRLVSASNNVIEHVVTTSSTFNGIAFNNSDNNVVKHCTSSFNNAFGVIMNESSDGNMVQHCTLAQNSTGLFIGGGGGRPPSFNNHVTHNRIQNNAALGIHVRDADANVLEVNVVIGNGEHGVVLTVGADRNLVKQNTVNNNGLNGLLITMPAPQSEHNQVISNRLHSNGTLDIRDATTGGETGGTRNYYNDNSCGTSHPEGLCGP